ncbi:MAG: dipeptide epimerase [Pirellulaceae bacterium]|nr:dipeptide epimerase [Pirellulaceae bacterium]
MKMTLHRIELPLAHPFTIARGSIRSQQSLVVQLEHDDSVGWGEVTENTYYGHTVESIAQSLGRVTELLPAYGQESPDELWQRSLEAMDGNLFALSALDIAAHDLHARRNDVPLYQDWGLTWDSVPDSSYTIGIDTIEKMIEKLAEQPDWSIYKIKLGTKNDQEIVQSLRQHSDAVFRVDANCGWTVDETIENAAALAQLNVEFIEQPLPADASEADKRAVFEQSALPIVADESCLRESDVSACRGLFHGINVKLCKCGGLTPALRMLRQAREFCMKTMVGCMIESSIGISAAAQLLPLLDYADLDGAVLLREDPAIGVQVCRGKVSLPDRTGTGAQWMGHHRN